MQDTTTTLPKHLLAEVTPIAPAKVHVPQTRKHRFSRTPAQAALEDGVDTTVRLSHVLERQMSPTEQALMEGRPVEIGVTEPLPEGTWGEVAMSECAFGCKVYANEHGRRVVAHNSNYGCYIQGTPA